ncbi:MAG: tetratricopeptide repeat protein [Planctomycetaceae bacterium]
MSICPLCCSEVRRVWLCLTIMLSLAAALPVTAQEKKSNATAKTVSNDPRIGKKFIVTKAGAELRTPDAVVWKSYVGETFTAALTNGEWLWINEKGGWLWEQETIPFDTAVQDLSARLAKAPTAENHHLRGIAYVAHRDFDRAIVDFSQSLKLKPNTAGVLNNRGQAYYLKGDYDAAIIDLTAAIKAEPKHFVAMNNRALAYIAKDQLDKARLDLDAALAINKEYPEALNNRGVVWSRTGKFPAAIVDFTAAVKLYDNYIDAYGNRSFAYRQLGRYKEAIADLKLSMQKSPLDYKPVNDLAWILATADKPEFRDPELAVKEATRACSMTQYTNWNTLDTLAAAYAAKGDKEKAVEWVTTAMQHAPDKYQKRLQEHRVLMREGRPIPQ